LPAHIKIEFVFFEPQFNGAGRPSAYFYRPQLPTDGGTLVMNTVFRLLALTLLLSFRPAVAHDMQTGAGLICDTQAQIGEYVKQTTHLNNREAALEMVNKATPKACGIVSFAFIGGKVVDTVQTPKGLYDVVESTVVAGFDGQWRPIPPTEQYTLVRSKAEAI
jgi:hypothetical protein